MKTIPEQIAELEALSAKATQGPWEVDTIRNDGEYGDGGPDSRTGFDSYAIFGADMSILLDSLNSTAIMVNEEYDEDGLHAWDEVGSCNIDFIVAAVNFLRANLPALKQNAEDAELLREVTVFMRELPQDLGRGSLNGMRAQLLHKVTAAMTKYPTK